MEQLPPHVATADEPIPALRGRPHEGPDLHLVSPIEVMLGELRQTEDTVAYLELWQRMVESVGGYITLAITREGDEDLRLGRPCDAQIRHRSRWLHYLAEDLHEDLERRDLLITTLITAGRYADNRPADPRATTRAIRDFIRTQGRILIDPEGNLTEGGGAPRLFTHGSTEEAAECVRASRCYFAVRRRWRSERHIKRVVRMLGTRTSNGWLVLEARA